MVDKITLDSINSACTNYNDLIRSKEFERVLLIILEKIDYYDKSHILSIFKKLKYWEKLNEKEINDFSFFINDYRVIELWKEILNKLKYVSLNININNSWDLISFSKILSRIFRDNWIRKIQWYIWKFAYNIWTILNDYKWFKNLLININWEEKEIYLENENLKVDSSWWKEENESNIRIKISPDWGIIEYIDWKLAWEQLFTLDSAIRESKKQWKRLPYADQDYPEFQEIIKKVWINEFKWRFPWWFDSYIDKFWDIWEDAYYWALSNIDNWDSWLVIIIYKDWEREGIFKNCPSHKFSVRCIIDNN